MTLKNALKASANQVMGKYDFTEVILKCWQKNNTSKTTILLNGHLSSLGLPQTNTQTLAQSQSSAQISL